CCEFHTPPVVRQPVGIELTAAEQICQRFRNSLVLEHTRRASFHVHPAVTNVSSETHQSSTDTGNVRHVVGHDVRYACLERHTGMVYPCTVSEGVEMHDVR